MHRKFFAMALTALVAIVAAESAAVAGDCGCSTAASGCCNPCDSCCQPRIRYRYEWVTCTEPRTRTCYRTVQKTVMKEVRECVCKPVTTTKVVECKKIVCKPVWEEKQVEVCTGDWVTEQVCVPGKCVTRCCRLPDTCCFDPCTCTCKRIRGECVTYTEKLPDTFCCKKTWVPRKETRTVKCCKMVPEEVVEKVNVCETTYVKEEVVKQVPCTYCEREAYCVTENVCVRKCVRVPYCDCSPSCLDRLRDWCKNLCSSDCGNRCCERNGLFCSGLFGRCGCGGGLFSGCSGLFGRCGCGAGCGCGCGK
jgi:hypothetical protein